jgi:hypothetical protein
MKEIEVNPSPNDAQSSPFQRGGPQFSGLGQSGADSRVAQEKAVARQARDELLALAGAIENIPSFTVDAPNLAALIRRALRP